MLKHKLLLVVFVGVFVTQGEAAIRLHQPRPDGYAYNEEESRWLSAVMSHVVPPEHLAVDRSAPILPPPGPPPPHSTRVHYQPPFFDTFPHGSAVLTHTQRRIDQGLPTLSLVSKRPGFPFYV